MYSIQPTRINAVVIRRKRIRASRVKFRVKETTAKIIKKIPGIPNLKNAKTSRR